MKGRFYILAIALCVLTLAACGIKPDAVDPPPGAPDGAFPRTYPDVGTDPRPYSH